MVQQPTAAAFWSYVHQDDQYEDGRITRLRERLEGSIRFHSGIRDFRIFEDRRDIAWGQRWERVIAGTLDQALLLFPVVTPSFFSSVECRKETVAFRQRQAVLDRDDLILPVYYFTADQMEDPDSPDHDAAEREVAALFKALQFEDCRALRRTGENDPAYRQAIERMAELAVRALKRSRAAAGKGSAQPVAAAVAAAAAAPASAQPPTQTPDGGGEGAAASHKGAAKRSTAAAGGDASAAVKALTVNQFPGRGDFTTIAEAVRRAPAGARILVSPGRYPEQVLIDKPLELVGDGPRDDVLIESDGPEPLVFDTNIGAVRNFTLRQTRAGPGDCCIWVLQGRLELEDCDVSSTGFACLGVTGNADPRVRRNRFHGGKGDGILIQERARGTYEDNEVFNNAFVGIEVKTGADPLVRRNRVHGNNEAGIFVHDQGRGTYEDNELSGNVLSGFEVSTGADPVFRLGRVHDNRGSGIFVHDQGRGTYEDSEVSGNALSGIGASSGADPLVRRNRIRGNKEAGVFVYDQGRGTYEDNEVSGNAEAGIEVKGGAHPTARNNRITGNSHEGVLVLEGGWGVFEGNDLRGNARGPWSIHPSAEAQVRRARNTEE